MFMSRALEDRLKEASDPTEQDFLMTEKMAFDRIKMELSKFFGSAIL
jgi:hypothetical protein